MLFVGAACRLVSAPRRCSSSWRVSAVGCCSGVHVCVGCGLARRLPPPRLEKHKAKIKIVLETKFSVLRTMRSKSAVRVACADSAHTESRRRRSAKNGRSFSLSLFCSTRTPAHGESADQQKFDADSHTQGESAVGNQLKAVVCSLSLLLDADSSTQRVGVGDQLKMVHTQNSTVSSTLSLLNGPQWLVDDDDDDDDDARVSLFPRGR